MISIHALSILVLLLAVGLVLLCSGVVYLQVCHSRELAKLNERLDRLELRRTSDVAVAD